MTQGEGEMSEKEMFEIIVSRASMEGNAAKIAETLVIGLKSENKMLPFTDRVVKMLPEVKELDMGSMEYGDLYTYITNLLSQRLTREEGRIQEKIRRFTGLAREKLVPAIEELLNLFELRYQEKRRFTCYLGFFNPFPRSVLSRQYWMHYDISDEVFLRASLHEIDHMILFDKWKALYGYQEEREPDYPDLMWFMEELTVEPTLNDLRIQRIVPIRHTAYDSLRAVTIEGRPLTAHIQELYDASGSIEKYLRDTGQFLQCHYTELC